MTEPGEATTVATPDDGYVAADDDVAATTGAGRRVTGCLGRDAPYG